MANSPSNVSPRPFESMRQLASNMVVGRLALLVILLLAWEIYAQFFADKAMLAPPSSIISALGPKIFGDPAVFAAIRLTLYELAIAFSLSIIIGLAIGVSLGLSDFGRSGLLPIVLLLYAIPQVVLLPLVVMLFGIGPVSKIVFGFSHGIFPVILTTVTGMRSVSPLLLRGAESTGASQWQLIRHVIFPHMVPTVFAGFRLTMTVTLLGVLLAELFVSISGIGYYASVFGQSYDPAPLFALILTLAFMAIMLNEFVRILERRFSRWKQ
jgi:ABC-type nitrate/sulfonate/bicarbonate transport system permease component